MLDLGVMTRSDKVGVQFQRPVHQRTKFEMPVASDARVWRMSGQILPGKIIDDIVGKSSLKIEYVMRNIQHLRYPPGIFDRRQSATATLRAGRILASILP